MCAGMMYRYMYSCDVLEQAGVHIRGLHVYDVSSDETITFFLGDKSVFGYIFGLYLTG